MENAVVKNFNYLTIMEVLALSAVFIGIPLLFWLLDLPIWSNVLMTAFFAPCLIVFLFFANRICYTLILENGKIKRRNLIGKAKIVLDIDSIIQIKIFITRADKYYVLCDGKHIDNSYTSKNATIFIPKTPKGEAFLRKAFEGRDSFETLIERKTY